MENNQIQPSSLFDRLNQWIRESIMVKLASIGILILLLLIPLTWVQNVIDERQSRADDVMREIAGKWSGNQTLAGPVLVLPYRHRESIKINDKVVEEKITVRKAYFLPETLNISGAMSPEILHRGIFEAIVYESSINISAQFKKPDIAKLEINEHDVIWTDAYLVLSISDLRGISTKSPIVTMGGKGLVAEPVQKTGIGTKSAYTEQSPHERTSDKQGNISETGIRAKLVWEPGQDFMGSVTVKFDLKGSNRLDFVPSGKTTSVRLTGNWSDPSFEGEFLPTTRSVGNGVFNAEWNILHFNRPFSQEWRDGESSLAGSEFGLRLLAPVEQYQKSMRTSKYGTLIILLTFISLFLVEITRKIQIHPFQYILVGVALVIFYSLLLSLSEHLGYNLSYWVSTLATVGLISLYAYSFLKEKWLTVVLSGFLSVFYSFIFVIILQQDFSLLIGSIGLFLILGAVMYFSRKVDWYK